MTDSRECTVAWCEQETHPDGRIIHHAAGVLDLAPRTAINIRLGWAEKRDNPNALLPSVRVFHGTVPETELTLSAGEAMTLAQMLADLHPDDMTRFAVALARGAFDIVPDSGREFHGARHWVAGGDQGEEAEL